MESKIKSVIFDLDGTLFSSHKNIYLCTLKTFKILGMEVNIPEEKFNKLIGHHFKDIFLEFGIYVNDIEGFIEIFKNHYFDFINHSKPYEGVFETIDFLNEKNINLALLTTKGQDQADRIMKHFGLENKFGYIMGRRPGMEIKPSPEPIHSILNVFNALPGETIMVGDSELDVMAGKNAGTLTAAVTYGYREREDLEKLKPDFLLDNISELKTIINGVS